MRCKECSLAGKPLGYMNVELVDFRDLHRFVNDKSPHTMQHVRRLSLRTTFYGDETDSEDTPSYKTSDSAGRRVLQKKGNREPEHRLADCLIKLLESCSNLEWLNLELDIFPHKSVLGSFRTLRALDALEITFCGSGSRNALGVDLVVSIALAIPKLSALTLTGFDCPCGCKAYPKPADESRHLKTALEAQKERYRVHVPEIRSYRSLPDILKIKTLTHLRVRNICLSDPKWKNAKPVCRLQKLGIGSCLPSKHYANQGAANRIMELFEVDLEELALDALPTQRPVPLTRPRRVPLMNLYKLHLNALMPAGDRKHTLYYLSGSPIRKLSISCLKSEIHRVRESLKAFHSEYPGLYPQLKKITFRVVEIDGNVRVVRPPFPICVARHSANDRSIWKQLDAILAGLSYSESGAWSLQCPAVKSSPPDTPGGIQSVQDLPPNEVRTIFFENGL